MNKKIFLSLILMLSVGLVNAQNSLWTKTTETRLENLQKFERTSNPEEASFFTLNLQAMKSALQKAPTRDFSGTISTKVISFPNAKGDLEQFSIYESSVMEPGLSSKHQEIQSYVGQGITNRSARIYLTTTVFGFHGMVLSDQGTYYIDPYTTDLKGYMVYNKASLTTSTSYICHNTEEASAHEMDLSTNSTMIADGIFRTYRLAMACTIEYANYHINAAIQAEIITVFATEAQKKAVVLAAMNVTVSRLNSVYEIDMSLRMQLVDNNESIIFITTDTFTNNNANVLIGESQTVINGAIGALNYDIGHTVSTGGGGLAQLGSVCGSSKARGITGSPAPVGDPFNIDFVAHEVGHQFGASHTFNGDVGNCGGGNRSQAQAVEPGSGTTIMAYAGICGSVNVQNNSDSYFHTVSVSQMSNFITFGGGNCAVGVSNANAAPVVEAISNYTIPKGTAFVLTGSATDDSASAMTYCWEQTNPGQTTANPISTVAFSNPNFRSFTPSLEPSRYFPALSKILVGNLNSTWEVIPNVARVMKFALTVRDNSVPNGGQISRKNMDLTFDAASGPFTVTSQNAAGITWTNTPQTVTWNVANTDVAPVNTANVNILLSTDGGLTFPITLIANTPNDGSEVVTVPGVVSSSCRIMIQAVDNVFIAVNTNVFAIDNQLSATEFDFANFKLYPNPNTGSFMIELKSESSNDIDIAIYDISGRQIFTKKYPNTGIFSQKLELNNVQSGVYLVNIQDGNQKSVRKIVIQ